MIVGDWMMCGCCRTWNEGFFRMSSPKTCSQASKHEGVRSDASALEVVGRVVGIEQLPFAGNTNKQETFCTFTTTTAIGKSLPSQYK